MGDREFRVLIVDDEQPARAKLRRFLADDPEVGAIHEAADGPTALAIIREEAPDLVLLDIQMPGLSGIEVLEALPEGGAPHVVFVTAHDEHAVRAFELAAVDYLLKPFDRERFACALGRAKRSFATRVRAEDLDRLRRLVGALARDDNGWVDRLLVADGGRRILVRLADVDWIEAERNYVRLHVAGTSRRVRGTLDVWSGRLDPRYFRRVSRGAIVNIDRVVQAEPAGHGDQVLFLVGGGRVRWSRRYRAALDPLAPDHGGNAGPVPGAPGAPRPRSAKDRR